MIRVPPAFASLALLLSAGFTGWTLMRALPIDSLPPPKLVDRMPGTMMAEASPPLAASRLAAAVGKDPFHPERRRPSVRFRLPGEADPNAADSTRKATPFKLIGTAAMAQGKGFAMCQWGQEPPKLVRIGDRVGDYTLKDVKPGRAVFLTANGERYEVQVPKAGS